MSLTTKRRLPNVNNQKMRQLNSNFINNLSTLQRTKDVRFNDNGTGYSTWANERSKVKHENSKTIKQQLNANDQHDSIGGETIQSRLDRRLHEIERDMKPKREDQQRKFPIPIYNSENKNFQSRAESNKQKHESQSHNSKHQFEETEINKNYFTQQDSTILLESTKTIRENVTHFKNQLIRNEIEHEKQVQKDEQLSALLYRRRKPEQDSLQLENEYLIQQKTTLSNTTTLNEMLNFKKELEKSEQKREQLSDHLESLIKTSDEKEKNLSKCFSELKELKEICETFEQQNTKLQNDLTLALEKLEEMTEEAERFAQESTHSQKQLADSEQKREESLIQTQETTKQWNAKVKKLEKDIERYKLDSTQILEKNQQLIKEIESLKSQNSTLKEQITKTETDLNGANTNYKRLDEQFQSNENEIIQLRTIRSSQEDEISSLKRTVNELESQASIHRQRLSQTDKEKQNLYELLQEEIDHRNNLDLKLKQSEKDIETINTSRYQLQQQIFEFENQRIEFLKEKTRFISIENDYEDIKKKLEITKNDYTRGMKALQMDYENKIEEFQARLSDEKNRTVILQRHQSEYKKDNERLQEKSAKFEDEATQKQCTIETLFRESSDKSRLINELESKITKLTVETTNQRNQMIKKDSDYENSLHTVYNDIIYCTKCLSNDSNHPFTIEPTTTPYDDIEVWSSKLKAHLAWLKQELEIRQQQEKKIREDLNNALLDCEADRKHFASELIKREIIINDLTKNHQPSKRDEYIQFEYDKQRILTENERGHIDDRYRQFQIMIDSVKRELHTAKVQLSA